MFREHTLENGLEIVVEENPQAYSTAVGFFVKTGARDETDEVSGVSHFLEHMMFKGTPTRSADDVNREFDEMGAHYNAFTSEENTVYYAAILPEHQDRAVALLADILRPALRAEDFETEKQVILEEIQMYEDQPPYGADDKCRAAFFGAHPLGRSVLGSLDSIRALPVDAMRTYFEHRYAPGNITLAAAGKVDFDRLIASVRQCCGHWPAVPAGRTLVPAQPHTSFGTLEKNSATQAYAIQLAGGPGAADDRRYAAKLLSVVLGDDSGSRLYWELIDPGLAEHISLNHYDYQGAGIFLTYLACAPEDARENLERVANIYRAVEQGGITATEVEQAKRKVNSRVVLGSERPRSRLFAVGTNWIQRRRYLTVREELERVAALNVTNLAAELEAFPLSKNATLVVGPHVAETAA